MSTPPNSQDAALRGLFLQARRDAERRKRAQEMAQRATANFYEFIKGAWHVVEPEHPFIPCWHIQAMADHLQAMVDGYIQNLLILVPPGSAKSTVGAVMLPAWQWTPGRRPGWRSTWASYGADISTRDSEKCRDLMKSVWYQETFQPTWRFSSTQDEKTYYVNSAKGFRVSTSVGGKGTGWRGSLIAADDPLNAKERHSETALRECIDWWDNVMFNRLDDMSRDNKLVIMQRLASRDLAGHLLSKGGYECLSIPMEYDPKRSKVTVLGPNREWRDPRQNEGEIMLPEKFPPEVIADLKKNPVTWETQYQQNPAADGGGILKPHKWRYWQPAGLSLPPVRVKMPDGSIDERKAVELPTTFDLVLQSWDCAFKDTKQSDYVVGQVHAVLGANRYILDQERGRLDLPATIQSVRALTGRHPRAHLKLVEDKANGPAVIQMLRDEIPGLQEVNPEGGKVARAAAAAVELDAGNWFLPHPMIASWVGNPEDPENGGGFLGETAMFPPIQGVGHDDQVDSWSQGAIRIQKERIGGVFGVSDHQIRVDHFEFDPAWPRLCGLSITWQEVGAIWITRKPETGEHYAYFEYSVAASDPAQHAAALLKPGEKIPIVIHAAEHGRTEKDGYALASRYQRLGVRLLTTIPNTGQAEISDLAEGLRSGKLKIFSNLGRFFDQYRSFRRDDDGKVPVYNAGVIRALCVAWKARDQLRSPVEPPKAPERTTYWGGPPSNSWMGG